MAVAAAAFLRRLLALIPSLFTRPRVYRMGTTTVRHVAALAEGAVGFVDVVEETLTGKRMALKRIVCSSDEQLKRARREVALVGRLDHPNIVQLLDWGEERRDASQVVVLMLLSLHPKGTLLGEIEWRRSTGRWFSEVELLSLFLPIVTAVDYLHGRAVPPIAHRDLKPGNVLLDDNVGAVLTDFDSAAPSTATIRTRAAAAHLQDEAARHSTVTYRAPELIEVCSSCTITTATDVWSLGCLLYAMCYGSSPLDEVLEAGGSIPLAVLSLRVRHRPRYSAIVRDLIDSMLQVEATSRPTASAIIAIVNAALAADHDIVLVEYQ